MRKTVMVKKEKSVYFCDLCKKEMQYYNSCSICNREFCDNCSKDMEHTSLIWYPPCPICVKFKDKYFDEIKRCFDKSEKTRDKGLDLMNKWKEESKYIS